MELTKEKIIDPKNKHTVGKSWANLGNHVLLQFGLPVWHLWYMRVTDE